MVRRSVLFTPGDDAEMLRKAPATGADTLVFDLEDGVAPDRKSAARETVREALADPDLDPAAEVCVRVTPPPTTDDDLAVVLSGGRPDAVMLPMVDDHDDVETLVRVLREQDAGGLPVLALVETARGVVNASAIADHPRVDALLLGAEDLAADLGATRTVDGGEVAYARSRVVTAASAAGVDAIDAVHTDLEDHEGLARATREAIDRGYDGKMVVHPAQVDVVNDAFTPDAERVEWAERVLRAAKRADEEGRGVFRVDDQMIDAPLVARAEQVVERARAAGLTVDGPESEG